MNPRIIQEDIRKLKVMKNDERNASASACTGDFEYEVYYCVICAHNLQIFQMNLLHWSNITIEIENSKPQLYTAEPVDSQFYGWIWKQKTLV